MANSLSNKYYLKALEAYPYYLEDAAESLDYALSYDSEHAGAHCLMGQLYMEQLRDYKKAEFHFERALIHDADYALTYELYSLLAIYLKEYDKALRIINFAYSIPAINRTVLKHREALVAENLQKLKKARRLMGEAYQESYNEEERNFLKPELDRIKAKLKEMKNKSKKK